MIKKALQYVVSELNDYLTLRAPTREQTQVVAGGLLNVDGTPNQRTQDKVAVMVVNLEEDRVYHSVDIFSPRPDGTSELVKPEVKINLYVLFVANLSEYEEALKALSLVICFFQHRRTFDYSAILDLNGHRGRVVFEMFSPTFEQQTHLWGALGAKFMPSVLYKAGILDISEEAVEGEAAPVLEVVA